MPESMTGTAVLFRRIEGRSITVTLRSTNSRYCEFIFRNGSLPISFEEGILEVLKRFFSRGKIEISIEGVGFDKRVRVNERNLDLYREIVQRHGNASDISFLLNLPGVIEIEDAAFWIHNAKEFVSLIEAAAGRLRSSRIREGNALKKILLAEIRKIRRLNGAIRKGNRLLARKIRLNFFDEMKGYPAISEELIAEKLVSLYEKQSIREEIDRLDLHSGAAMEALERDESGREIDFIAQEMLREANTIGSKSRDFQIRSHVVAIKCSIDTIKEQAKNLC
jgi:uncharacterized protein (TIGR00255 family)